VTPVTVPLDPVVLVVVDAGGIEFEVVVVAGGVVVVLCGGEPEGVVAAEQAAKRRPSERVAIKLAPLLAPSKERISECKSIQGGTESDSERDNQIGQQGCGEALLLTEQGSDFDDLSPSPTPRLRLKTTIVTTTD